MANRLRWAEAIEPLFGNTFIKAEPLFSRRGARLQKYAGRKPVELADNSQLRQCSMLQGSEPFKLTVKLFWTWSETLQPDVEGVGGLHIKFDRIGAQRNTEVYAFGGLVRSLCALFSLTCAWAQKPTPILSPTGTGSR